MNSDIATINKQNQVAVMLMQSLWGAISPNFRMVAISIEKPVWQIHFVLEKDNLVDREEISDISDEFESLLDNGRIQFDVKVDIVANDLPWPDSSYFVVFRRREGI